jgi:hypothetical protein
MANEKSNQRLVAQLPRLEDDNFKFWMQSLTLIARGLAIHEYLKRDNKPDEMSRNARRLYYLVPSEDNVADIFTKYFVRINTRSWR